MEGELAHGLAQAGTSPTKPGSPSGAQQPESAEESDGTSRVAISEDYVKANFPFDHPLYSLLNPRSAKEQMELVQAISNVLRLNKSEARVLSFSYASQVTSMRVPAGPRPEAASKRKPTKLSMKKDTVAFTPMLHGGIAHCLALMKLATLETETISKEDVAPYQRGNRELVRYYFVFNGPLRTCRHTALRPCGAQPRPSPSPSPSPCHCIAALTLCALASPDLESVIAKGDSPGMARSSLDSMLRLFGGMDTRQYATCMTTLIDFSQYDAPNDAVIKYCRLATWEALLPGKETPGEPPLGDDDGVDALEAAVRAGGPLGAQPDEFLAAALCPADNAMLADDLANREIAAVTAASKAEAAMAAPQPEGKRGRPATSLTASPLVAAPKAPRFGGLGIGSLMSGISGLMSGAVPPPPAPPKDGSHLVLPPAQSQQEEV